MIQLELDDTLIQPHLYPFTYTRSAADIRIGILTIRQKWEQLLSQKVRVKGEEYLTQPLSGQEGESTVFAANILPSIDFIQALLKGNYSEQDFLQQTTVRILQYPWQIFEYNDWALREDFKLITMGRYSVPIPESVQVMNARNIFIEEGAKLEHCILNAGTGPIYIGKNTEIMEGSIVRGPFALCEGAVLKMGTKIYGATTVGPYSVVGGEVKNSVIFGYSNKAHDGYLGDSVIGEWCNLGAGTSNSNIKNTASEINVWNYAANGFITAGVKCGLMMGDYSRCAINTSFTTGSMVGVCCNVLAEGLTTKYIPNFTWGNNRYEFEKALRDIANWKQLKKQSLTEKEIQQLRHIFEQTIKSTNTSNT
jgi:UDP-N-acetylglucosamine diphosphorylase / glucose-1-phosphate thymidylyltransferase / UDP-N-acetylgalactosamine diphosphorylase / glucosamine-1-phosphate N-acetyltransferase / galactosamine-1-phosphate N-acetyltransferase